MALSFIKQPSSDLKQPAWNDINYIVSSTNTTESGFKVVAKAYVSGVLKQTFNLYIYPSTTRVFVNIKKVVQNYITDEYQGKLPSPNIAANQTLPSVYITFQEYYDGTLQGSILTSDTIKVWRAAFPPLEMTDEEFSRWQLDSGIVANDGTINMLTPFQNTINGTSGITPSTLDLNSNFLKLKEGQRYFLRWIRDSTATSINITVRIGIYDNTGTRTHSDYISYVNYSNSIIKGFAVGTDEIESQSWNTGFSLTDSDKYIAIELTDQNYSQTYNYLFEFDWTPCDAFQSYEVHWLNRYGGFDSWVFNRNSKESIQVTQESFKSSPFDIDSGDHVPSARYIKPFHTQIADVIDMNTQNLKEWEYQGIRDLFTSPEVYVKVATPSTEYFVSAVVLNNSVVQNKRSQDGIFNVNVQLKIDNSEQRQW